MEGGQVARRREEEATGEKKDQKKEKGRENTNIEKQQIKIVGYTQPSSKIYWTKKMRGEEERDEGGRGEVNISVTSS